jgi:hypothetical protein
MNRPRKLGKSGKHVAKSRITGILGDVFVPSRRIIFRSLGTKHLGIP